MANYESWVMDHKYWIEKALDGDHAGNRAIAQELNAAWASSFPELCLLDPSGATILTMSWGDVYYELKKKGQIGGKRRSSKKRRSYKKRKLSKKRNVIKKRNSKKKTRRRRY
jgi:hypothetical protein